MGDKYEVKGMRKYVVCTSELHVHKYFVQKPWSDKTIWKSEM
jgi:hypothetical protein